MRYRTNQPWPVLGGSMLLPSGTIIDHTQSDFLKGVVPPPTVTPLDAPTRDWLVRIYTSMPGHNQTIEQVPQTEK
jgi:hypothetical protein